MKNAKQLREEIAALCDRVKAITDLATAENRELSVEETAEIDGVHGTAKTPGKLAGLETALERAIKIETAEGKFAAGRAQETVVKPTVDAPIAIRVKPHRHGALKAFKGAEAEAQAYKAGRFLMATLYNDSKSQRWCADHSIDTRFMAAHQESSNELGGFLVPEEMERSIINLRETYGVFRRESKIVPMAGDTKVVPRRTGGLTAYFGGEDGLMTESYKSWDQVKLVTKKLYALSRYSNELNEDAIISIGDDLTDEMAYAFSVKEDQCGFLGDGTSTYGGIVGCATALNAGSIFTATGHTQMSALTLGDYETLLSMVPNYVLNPRFYVSQAFWAASMVHLMNAGGGNWTISLMEGTRQHQFLGYDAVISQALSRDTTTAATGTIVGYFGDLGMATTMGDRRGITVQRSDQRYFEYDEIGIRGTERFDINVHERGTATAAGALIAIKLG